MLQKTNKKFEQNEDRGSVMQKGEHPLKFGFASL